MKKITIIGAGLSGLSAAYYLEQNGFEDITILESKSSVGGRLKTDLVNGFTLDRGFQVLLMAYPEAKKILDYEALNLKKFAPGALIFDGSGKPQRIGDPLRDIGSLLPTIFSSVGTLMDKIKILTLRNRLVNKSLDDILEQPEKPTAFILKDYGFSDKFINGFFKPFYAGIFLENSLTTSRRMFDFVFKMFAEGDTAVPANGMAEIPKQIAAKLKHTKIIFNCSVEQIQEKTIYIADNQRIESDIIIIATEASNSILTNLKPSISNRFQGTTNVYFEADVAPYPQSLIALLTHKNKTINNLCVVSNVAPNVAPLGKHLISVSTIGLSQVDDETLAQNIKNELVPSFGESVNNWKMLKTYHIRYALPNQDSISNVEIERLKINDFTYCTADGLSNGSINAALKSGRLVAESIK